MLSTGGTNPFRDQVWSDADNATPDGKSEDVFGDLGGAAKPEDDDFAFDPDSIPINVLTSLEQYEELVEVCPGCHDGATRATLNPYTHTH